MRKTSLCIHATCDELIRQAQDLDDRRKRHVVISERRLRTLVHEASLDYLTGLRTYRQFRRDFTRVRRRLLRGKAKPVGLVLIDIVGFGELNKSLGHDRANDVLRKFALALKHRIKSDRDVAYRFGGDEFLLMLRIGNRTHLNGVLRRLMVPYELTTDRNYTLNTYAVGALARRKTDGANVETRIHRMLKKMKTGKNSNAHEAEGAGNGIE